MKLKFIIKSVIIIGIAILGLTEIIKLIATRDVFFIISFVVSIVMYIYDDDLLKLF